MNFDNDINNNIQFLAKSEIRLKILSELYTQPNTVRGIVDLTKITYSSVSSNISKLEKNNYLKKIKNNYHVTSIAEVYFKTLMDFKNSANLIDEYSAFWNKHNLKQLSLDSMRTITDLKDSELIETTPLDIYKTHNIIKDQLIESTNMKAIFPYLHPDYPGIIETILGNDGHVEIIIPKLISKELISNIDPVLKKNSIKENKLKIYSVQKDLELYLTICENNMSLGLFKNDGSFDQNRILISDNPHSKNWAEPLFEHVKKQVI